VGDALQPAQDAVPGRRLVYGDRDPVDRLGRVEDHAGHVVADQRGHFRALQTVGGPELARHPVAVVQGVPGDRAGRRLDQRVDTTVGLFRHGQRGRADVVQVADQAARSGRAQPEQAADVADPRHRADPARRGGGRGDRRGSHDVGGTGGGGGGGGARAAGGGGGARGAGGGSGGGGARGADGGSGGGGACGGGGAGAGQDAGGSERAGRVGRDDQGQAQQGEQPGGPGSASPALPGFLLAGGTFSVHDHPNRRWGCHWLASPAVCVAGIPPSSCPPVAAPLPGGR